MLHFKLSCLESKDFLKIQEKLIFLELCQKQNFETQEKFHFSKFHNSKFFQYVFSNEGITGVRVPELNYIATP